MKGRLLEIPGMVPVLALGLMLAACAAELENPDLYKNALGAAAGGAAGSPPAATGGGPPAGTGGTPPSGTGGSPAVSDCWKRVITTNCELCHTTDAPLGGLDLSGGDAVTTRLVGVEASNETVANMTSCVPGALLIDATNPMNSVMYKRLKGTQDCGTKMPQVGMLSPADAKCVDDWILSF